MKKGYIMECQICMFEAIDKLDSFIIGFLIVGQGKRGLEQDLSYATCTFHVQTQ